MVPASERLPEARALIDDQSYFVVHAPRQTGKTTSLRALAKELTAEGRYAALHFTCETAEPAQDDYGQAEKILLGEIRAAAESLPPELWPLPWPDAEDGGRLGSGLRAWSAACPRPVVLFFHEIDALRGESLRSVLRQLRAGLPNRPTGAPWSVVLCRLRDVRDYKVAAGGDPTRLGTSSPFNVKVKSERLGHFSESDVHALYMQHTEESGQPFALGAIERAFDLTQGQPWLVNALAREVTAEVRVAPPTPITAEHMDEAKERLILAQATHLDSLVSKLAEPRVRRVLEPVLAGGFADADLTYDDDVGYVRDLGLIAPTRPVRVANPIYREVIGRVLASGIEEQIVAEPKSFVKADGRLDLDKVLREFSLFWRQYGPLLHGKMPYREVSAQLVLLAYLQRVVNGGGYVEREYGVGRGRIDVCIRWPLGTDSGRTWQVEGLELKVWADSRPDPLAEGLRQIEGYLEGLGIARGTLVLFDRRTTPAVVEEAEVFSEATTPKGLSVCVMRA